MKASMATDWQDPEPTIDRNRLAFRLGFSLVIFVIVVALTRSFLAESIPLLWPPTDPLDQWSMLVLLHAFGYVIVPLMIGSVLADRLLGNR